MIAVVDQLSSDQNEFLLAILPEAVLGMKETNERARSLACDLVVKMGYAAHRCSQLSPQGMLHTPHCEVHGSPLHCNLKEDGPFADVGLVGHNVGFMTLISQ